MSANLRTIVPVSLVLALGVSCSGTEDPSAVASPATPQGEEVSGVFAAGGARSNWRAWFDCDDPSRLEEERSMGDRGNVRAVWEFEGGRLARYSEESLRQISPHPTPTTGLTEITIEIEFEDGRFVRGSKTVGGEPAEPDKHEARAAWNQGMILLDRARLVRQSPAPSFDCRGNEPFWNLQIRGHRLTYKALTDAITVREFHGDFQWITGMPPDPFEWSGAEVDDPSSTLEALITPERCLDTMSDETPPFSHSIRLLSPEGDWVDGCCNAGEGEPAG